MRGLKQPRERSKVVLVFALEKVVAFESVETPQRVIRGTRSSLSLSLSLSKIRASPRETPASSLGPKTQPSSVASTVPPRSCHSIEEAARDSRSLKFLGTIRQRSKIALESKDSGLHFIQERLNRRSQNSNSAVRAFKNRTGRRKGKHLVVAVEDDLIPGSN